MPNYVRNLIRVVDGDFQAVARLMKSETNDFDFNKLISMPPSMLALKAKYNGISPKSELGFAYWSNPYQRCKGEKYAIINKIKERGYNLRQTLREGLDRLYVYADCGYWNSLEWAIAKWGTKWNAFDIDIDKSDKTIFFNTAWNAPIPIYKALAKQFPTYTIRVKYYDEGGWFAGTCDIKNGNTFGEDYECESEKGEKIINEIKKYIMTNKQKAAAWDKASELAAEATKTDRATYEEVRQACIEAIKWQAKYDKLMLNAKDNDIDWKVVYDAEVVRHAELKAELDALKDEYAKAQQQLAEYRQALAELSNTNSKLVKDIAVLSVCKGNAGIPTSNNVKL